MVGLGLGYCLMFFCSFVFLCVTSSVSFTGFYTEDEPNFLSISLLITDTGIVLRVRPLTDSVRGPGKNGGGV